MRTNCFLISSLFLIMTTAVLATSIDFQCVFKNDDFDNIINQYSCIVQANLYITTKTVEINKIFGTHSRLGLSNDDVNGLTLRDKKIQYFPQNLGEKFKNLIAVRIREGRLKEVTQNDLKQLTKLRYLNLDANDIEILDSDLFEFNPQLEVIWFEGNRIKAIGIATFSSLKKLRDLDLNKNLCVSQRISVAREVPAFLIKLKQLCSNPEVELTKLKGNYQKVIQENEAIKMEIEELKAEILKNQSLVSDLESSIKNLTSKVSLKEVEIQQITKQMQNLNQEKELLQEKLTESIDRSKGDLEQRERLRQSLKESAYSLNESHQKISQLELELDENVSKLLDLEQKYNNSQVLANKSLDDVIHLQDKIKKLNEIEMELRQNVSGLMDQLEEQEINFENLTNILDNKTVTFLENELKIQALKIEIQNSIEKIEQLKSQHTLELSNMESDLKNLTEKLKNAEENFDDLQQLNTELSDELANITQTAEALTKVSDTNHASTPFLLVGLAVFCILTIVNILVAVRFYRTKTVVLKPMEVEESFTEEMM